MTFQPVIAGAGIVGWRFLQSTYVKQFEAFAKSPQLSRDSTYFLQNIGSVSSAEDLVNDRRLLGVALGAFGLQDDINSRYFIQRILGDGTSDSDALANKLADKRYRKLSDAFGFGPGEVRRTVDSQAMLEIAARNQVEEFEVAVGESDETMRIALYAQHELVDIANGSQSETSKWFTVLGLPPLRKMFETGLGLPSGVGQVDIDKQVEIFQDRLSSLTGSSDISQFNGPESMERITNLFLARSQIEQFNSATSSSAIALQLLQSV